MTAPDHAWGLAVPFVVCQSQGGPFDDVAFCAGFEAGRVSQALSAGTVIGANRLRFTVRTDLVKQLDLIAMDAGYLLSAAEVEETEDYPAMPEWSVVTLERQP